MAETSADQNHKPVSGRTSLDMGEFQEKHGMNKPRKISLKSIAWRAAAALGIGAVGAAVDHGSEPVNTVVQGVTTGLEKTAGSAGEALTGLAPDTEGDFGPGGRIYGKFLNRQKDGSLILSDTPQVVKVTYTPNADPTTRHWNENNIVVRRKPQADFGGSNDVPPEEIRAPYAVRVAGGAFGGPSEVTRFQVTDSSGQKHTVGEWFQFSDLQGNPVSLSGEPLKDGEEPYFVAANFVTVEPAQTPTQ